MWFIGVELEQETSAPPPKKNPGSAPVIPHKAMIVTVVDPGEGPRGSTPPYF